MVKITAFLLPLIVVLVCTAQPAQAGDVRRSPGTRASPASPATPSAHRRGSQPHAGHHERRPWRRSLPCPVAPWEDWDLYASNDNEVEALVTAPVAPVAEEAPAVVLEPEVFIPASDLGTPAQQARRASALARLLDRHMTK